MAHWSYFPKPSSGSLLPIPGTRYSHSQTNSKTDRDGQYRLFFNQYTIINILLSIELVLEAYKNQHYVLYHKMWYPKGISRLCPQRLYNDDSQSN